MRDWWLSLQQRERILVASGGGVFIILLLYLLAWEPFSSAQATLANNVEAQRKTLAWMQDSSQQIEQLRSQSSGNATKNNNDAQRSLLSIIDTSAKRANVRKSIQRMNPQGKNNVKLWIENADFDALIHWISDLQKKYGIEVAQATFSRDDNPGRVDSRLNLQRP